MARETCVSYIRSDKIREPYQRCQEDGDEIGATIVNSSRFGTRYSLAEIEIPRLSSRYGFLWKLTNLSKKLSRMNTYSGEP